MKTLLLSLPIIAFTTLYVHSTASAALEHADTQFQKRIFYEATDKLEDDLGIATSSDVQFLKTYRRIRTSLFKIQVMAKFFEKERSHQSNPKTFGAIRALTKEFEDRIGQFNELDELTTLLPRSERKAWKLRLLSETVNLRVWMQERGWVESANEGALSELHRSLVEIHWLKDQDAIAYFRKRLAKKLRKLQAELAEGVYSPVKHSGYDFEEVESKVHELRRKIRELTMIMQYAGGVFTFVSDGRELPREAAELVSKFDFVKGLPSASTPFARLPRVASETPIFVPRILFLLFTEYTFEIGAAKDWALYNHKLIEQGFQGTAPDLNAVNSEIRDIHGKEQSFNSFMKLLIESLISDNIFTAFAEVIENQ